LVAHADASETALGPGKSLALLAYLAVRRQARRDELISLVWGEMPEDQARNAFRQSLHRIRKTLGADLVAGDRDTIALTSGASGVSIDRDEFLQAVETERWADAFAAYQGDFLEGFELGEPAFDRWAGVERMQLRSRFQTTLRRHAERALEAGDPGSAAVSAARLVASAPYEHDAALFQANVLLAGGKSAEALATLRQFMSRLQSELELPAPAEVLQLMNRLERSTVRSEAGGARPHANDPRIPPFVGRDPQLARLISGVTRAREEHGSAFLIEAEAGLGRTRLLDELSKRARDLGKVHILRGRERTAANVVPYAGIAEALRPLANAAGVAGASRHLLAEAARILPELRDSFDLPAPLPIEDEAGRLRFFEGVAAIVDAAAYEQPVCILLDDVHHASPPTLDLLGYLVGRLQTSPVMFVLSIRGDRTQSVERIRGIVSSANGSSEAFVSLPPLSSEETRTLVEASFPESARQTIDVDRIVRQSRGRPLLAMELAKRAAAGETLSEVPTLLRDVLWARLQTAAPSQRRVFFAAALLERPSPVRLLAVAAHLPESAALEAAVRLSEAGLLRDEGSGFVVAHESTLSFVVDASGIAGRAMLAGWAADALAAEDPGSDAELANLYAMAGRASMAFTHARAAAFDSAAVGALTEARHHLGVALTFAPDDKSRSEIESLLAAYGFGSLRLAGAVDEPAPASVPESEQSNDARPVEPATVEPTTKIESPARSRPALRTSRARRAAREWYMAIALSVIIVLLGILARRQFVTPAATSTSDSLLVERRDRSTGENAMFAVPISRNGVPGALVAQAPLANVGWVTSLAAPWSDPLVSPNRALVALTRVTAQGRELFVIGADRRDTTKVAAGDRDNIPLAWSPDSRSLLLSRSRLLDDGSYDSDLYLAHIGSSEPLVALDTSSSRSIADARWSPTGVEVAWIARVGSTRQRDIFVSRADGSGARNISSSPADDYGIAWSPDASLLAFTSTRDGGPRLYTYDFDNDKLWNVSDRDGEDRATFSPDGRYVAFESAHNGAATIYVRPALGGAARRVTPEGGEYSLAGWTKATDNWIERVRIIGATTLSVGDTTTTSVLAVAANGSPVAGVRPVWSVQGGDQIIETQSVGGSMRIAAKREGTARLIASLAGWRADTVTLVVAPANNALRDDFNAPLSPARWITLGDPQPFVGPQPQSASGHALFPNGDLEWDSGVVSRSIFTLSPGVVVRARLLAPFSGRPSASTITIGFAPVGTYDVRTPQVHPAISISWDGQSNALHYTVGRDTYSDAPAVRSDSLAHDVQFRIAADSTVIFTVDGRDRWRSSLRYSADFSQPRVQLWVGGRATGRAVAVASVSAEPARR
jgi:DNA-binding SARP family transcriptional activator